MASDKGLSAELMQTAPLFCQTTIADDLQPIVDARHRLMKSKMSQESLAEEQATLHALWVALSKKHQAAIAALPLTARLVSLTDNTPWLREVADQTWAEVQRQCPDFAKKHGNAEVIREFWFRRLPELGRATK
jgi:hypothetical protein